MGIGNLYIRWPDNCNKYSNNYFHQEVLSATTQFSHISLSCNAWHDFGNAVCVEESFVWKMPRNAVTGILR